MSGSAGISGRISGFPARKRRISGKVCRIFGIQQKNQIQPNSIFMYLSLFVELINDFLLSLDELLRLAGAVAVDIPALINKQISIRMVSVLRSILYSDFFFLLWGPNVQ